VPAAEAPRRLRLARVAAGLSQDQLAEAVGVSRQAVAAMERGRHDPSLAVALRLAAVLGSTVEELFGGEAEVPGGRALLAPAAQPGERAVLHRAGGRLAVAGVGGRPVGFGLVGDVAAGFGLRPASAQLHEAVGPREAGSPEVTIRPLRPGRPTVVVAGCDPALALLAEPLGRQEPPLELLWWPCSSRQALALLAAGLVHAAGVHGPRDSAPGGGQLGPALAGQGGGVVVGFTRWVEGLVLAPELAQRVDGVAALAEKGLRVANREPGAEARRVLEDEATRAGVPLAALPGADSQVPGHLQVASAVASGLADAGVALEPAAVLFGLGFLPLVEERFDLVVPRARLGDPEVRGLLQALGGDLRRQLLAVPGYGTGDLGEVLATL
jgi:putative molybdopterin biosynthesis protein